MNSFLLKIGTRVQSFSGPQCWPELTNRQRVGIVRVRQQAMATGQPTPYAFALLTLLYGIPPRWQRWLFDADWLRRQGHSEPQIEQALEYGQALLATLDWITTDDQQATFARPFRLFDHQSGLHIGFRRLMFRRRYAGPGAGLDNATFQEYRLAERAYRSHDWPLLTALLYRPVSPAAPAGADPRLPLDLNDVEARARLFIRLDPALLESVALSFGHTLLLLQRMFRHVFPRSIPDGQGSAAATLLDVAIGMANFDPTKVPAIEQSNLYLVLRTLDRQLKQDEEMTAKLNAMRQS